MHKLGHILFHVGAVTLQVATVAGHFAPFPFNVAIVGGVAATQGIVALTRPVSPPPKQNKK